MYLNYINKINPKINNDSKIVSLLNYKKKYIKKCKRCGREEHNELECIETTYKIGDKLIFIQI